MGLSIDPTSFLHDEVKKAKIKLEKALKRGNSLVAAKQAKRVAELLRELARYKRVGGKELLDLAEEYEDLAKRLRAGELVPIASLPKDVREAMKRQPATYVVTPGLRPTKAVPTKSVSEVGKLDVEFETEAVKLIAKSDVTWDDIAGLDEVKKALMEAIYYSIAKPEAPVKLEPPRRFLLFGPPGTGKTMLAMAASNMLKATFFNVSVDRVLSRYVGDSPRMIAAVFRVAYKKAPSIIFFDEVETLVVKRDSGRETAIGLVQTFLTELDGFKSKQLEKPVIVIAATNKPWMLDEAVLSRFEKRIYIPLPDRKARIQLFKLEIEKKGFKLEGITYEELADMTKGYSGRDIRNACKEAVMMMLRRANPDIYFKITKVQTLQQLQQERFKISPIKREEVIRAIKKIKPAVTKEHIKMYEEWAQKYAS